MRTTFLLASAALMFLGNVTSGCISASPPDRIQAYLGPAVEAQKGQVTAPVSIPSEGFDVGLLVINDTTHPDSAPPLSEEILAGLTVRAQQQIERNFPVHVTKMIPSAGIVPDGNPDQFARLANEHDLDHLMLVIFSSNESEIPTYLGIGVTQPGASSGGGGTGPTTSPGYHAENYALVEMALLETKSEQIVIMEHGRAWASLDRLSVPMESNIYPVVRRSLEVAPIFPTEEGAHDTLRGISGDDALTQALFRLKQAWVKELPRKKEAVEPA